ncbi:Cna B-type domain-containing protein [Periweissella beninensis]|uniref:Cna B-type domain-containing protein n=1 Tax=Periweissella beninensis TaxID=504936 RepID=A0ABT0VJ22_9LACO|nr:Cna B-type domain-containing protein [Periweissella beninensis]
MWQYTFNNLPLNADGHKISYTVKEVDTPTGYTAQVNQLDDTNAVITNTHVVTPTKPVVPNKTNKVASQTTLSTTSIPSYITPKTKNTLLPKTDMKRNYLTLIGFILLIIVVGSSSFYFYKRNKRSN